MFSGNEFLILLGLVLVPLLLGYGLYLVIRKGVRDGNRDSRLD